MDTEAANAFPDEPTHLVVGVPHGLVAVRVRQVARVQHLAHRRHLVVDQVLDHGAVVGCLAKLVVVRGHLRREVLVVGQSGVCPGIDARIHVHTEDQVVAVGVRGRAQRRGSEERRHGRHVIH